ncbi:hypothetical protein BDZ94DRAFT_1245809 [Collybia nuda]|uniref:Uncharacterized protein n=1 Tax=Collybia nuda TaxID=64659 RepID=A0A9P5YGQ7_9AGAR|nr:hypothetical protein BDZ94DRAFT_1245809 [Collybia nuda]
MSVPTTTVSTAPNHTPTQSSPPNRSGGNTTGNLYLITFLATLFLLLFISCAIVLRSYILRRRFQQQLDEAMAAGILLAPRSPGSRKRRFGSKPKFFEAWLVQGGERWKDMMPISALPVQVKRRNRNSTPMSNPSNPQQEEQAPSSPQLPSAPPVSASFHQKLLRAVRGLDEITPPTGPEKPARVRVDMLQISVLVAMPTPSHPSNSSTYTLDKRNENEETIPEVVFGVTRLPYKPPT